MKQAAVLTMIGGGCLTIWTLAIIGAVTVWEWMI